MVYCKCTRQRVLPSAKGLLYRAGRCYMLRVIQEKIAICCGLRILSESFFSDGALYSHALDSEDLSVLLP